MSIARFASSPAATSATIIISEFRRVAGVEGDVIHDITFTYGAGFGPFKVRDYDNLHASTSLRFGSSSLIPRGLTRVPSPKGACTEGGAAMGDGQGRARSNGWKPAAAKTEEGNWSSTRAAPEDAAPHLTFCSLYVLMCVMSTTPTIRERERVEWMPIGVPSASFVPGGAR
jgi:hypothetical protein